MHRTLLGWISFRLCKFPTCVFVNISVRKNLNRAFQNKLFYDVFRPSVGVDAGVGVLE